MNIQTKKTPGGYCRKHASAFGENLKSKPFPNRADEEALKSVCKDVSEAIFESNSYIAEEFKFIDMNAIGDSEKERLMAAHLISPNLALRSHGAAVMVNKNEQISILVNEEKTIFAFSVFCPAWRWKMPLKLPIKLMTSSKAV